MEIEVAIKMKKQCESEIKAILRMFEMQTGFSVSTIRLQVSQNFGKSTEVFSVEIEAKL